jgi:phenylacetate-CoA ligase
MAEMTPWMNAAGSRETQGMMLWQDIIYTEVCDPRTFTRVPYGQRGTPVYTHLERTSQPMIRLLSGDLTRWEEGPSPCGRTYPLLPDGVFGRIDDGFTIRGENVYPSEIDAVLNGLTDYGGEHRIIISREGAMDELLVQVEGVPGVYQQGGEKGGQKAGQKDSTEAFRQRVAADLQRTLGIRTQVEVVAPETFPRTDFKARRVVDDRQVFRDMHQRLDPRP